MFGQNYFKFLFSVNLIFLQIRNQIILLKSKMKFSVITLNLFLQIFRPCTIHVICHSYSHPVVYAADIIWLKTFVILYSTVKYRDKTRQYGKHVDLHHKNVSLLFQNKYPSKLQLFCTVELFMTSLVGNKTSNAGFLKVTLQNQIPWSQHKFRQPNFIIFPIDGVLKFLTKIYYVSTMFTWSAIILLDLATGRICLLDIALTKDFGKNKYSDHLNGLDLFGVRVPAFDLMISGNTVKSLTDLIELINANNFPKGYHLKTIKCPVEYKRRGLDLNWWSMGNWLNCVEEIITSKYNCTDYCLLNSITKNFKTINQHEANTNELVIVNGHDMYEIKYTIFFTINSRNIYALFSPFSLKEWNVILINFDCVRFVLWLLNPGFIPFFWLFTVFLEQNDDSRKTLTKHSFHLIASWIYVVLLLRNFYTSNLYTYLTMSRKPTNLPSTFKDVPDTDSFNLLAPARVFWEIEMPIANVAFEQYLTTKSYQLVNLISKKYVELIASSSSVFENIGSTKTGSYDVCKTGLVSQNIENNCEHLNTFGYLVPTGPFDQEDTYIYKALKILLKLSRIRAEIVENKDANLFQIGQLFVSTSDNFFKSIFEKSLGFISQAGIDLLQKSYIALDCLPKQAVFLYHLTDIEKQLILKQLSIIPCGDAKLLFQLLFYGKM